MIKNHMNYLPEVIFNLTYLVISVGVSWVYWQKVKGSVLTRSFVSFHSISLLVVLVVALLLGLNGFSSLSFQTPFTLTLLMPVASIAFSIKAYDGLKRIHILHLWNVVALIWTWFIGSMALTGDWL